MGVGMALRFKLWLSAVGAFVVALGAAYFRGRSDEAEADTERELNEYVETRKRMDQSGSRSDLDDSLEWLRKRQQSKRDL
jgi:dienelactone hydrolase